MKYILLFIFPLLSLSSKGQAIEKIAGSYISIDSTSTSYEKNGIRYKDIDTTLLTFNGDMSFSYKWSPMFGAYSNTHIVTTGTWKLQNNKVLLNSKYQQGESRFTESYKPEYGDSIVKVYVQTYDSLVGFFQFQYIAVAKDTSNDSKPVFADKDVDFNAASATFHFPYVDKIVFYGDFGHMPVIKPANKRSNYFLLQYNLSGNWDYQYFKDFEVKVKDGVATLGKGKDSIGPLRKI